MRLTPEGRGRRYTPRRGLVEALLRVAYRGDWPAHLWSRVPGAARIDVIRLELPLLPPRGPGVRRPLRIAFASDLHIGPTTPSRTLDAAFHALDATDPDVLLLGGDYVFLDATDARADELEARLRAAPGRTKLAVLGNHDLWTRHDRIERALDRAGVRLLVNDAARLPAPHDDVMVAGLDDAWTGDPDPDRAIAATRGAALVLGLAHSPEGAALLTSRGVPLVLAGHTHGGHVALPGGRPIVVPGPLGRAHPWGRHTLHGGMLFVSRGVGGIEIPMRLFARPDVVCATIVEAPARAPV